MTAPSDSVLRAMTDDGAFRVITARTTDTVRGVLAAQAVDGRAETSARWFGDLVTGTILVRETMAPTLRVQAVLQAAAGRGRLVADAQPDGSTRGLVQRTRVEPGEAPGFGPGSLLQVMRTLPSGSLHGSLHKGVVELPPGGGISEGLMAYLQVSEQVSSMITVGSVFESGEVVAAGGYVVQLLPELSEGPLMVMTERLQDFRTMDSLLRHGNLSPGALLDELLYGFAYTRLAESPLRYRCWCSEVRVVTSLATLPRADIEEMVADAKPLEITCDYCGQEYRIAPEQLRGLLEPS